MDREQLLADVLAELADGAAAAARETCRGLHQAYGDPVAGALAAVAGFWMGEFDEAAADATAALAAATDDRCRALALAASGLARTGVVGAAAGVGDDPVLEAMALVDRHDDRGRWWTAVRYLVAEAALDSARLDDAAAAVGPDPVVLASSTAWAGHPFSVVLAVCAVRVAAFRGRIEEATTLLAAAHDAARPPRLDVAVEALDCLVLGNAADPRTMDARDRIVAAVPSAPSDFVERGVLLLMAYGAIAVGEVAAAAALVFRAGGDDALRHCTVVDRGLGLELLLTAALAEDDLDAAAAWVTRLAELANDAIAGPTVERALSRYAHATGDLAEAIRMAERSTDACRVQGRVVEAAEGELVLARYRIEGRDLVGVSQRLRELVVRSDKLGHAAVRRSASSALGVAGRRLPPVAGGGWAVLSAREAEVARLILVGRETDEIADELFLTPATVRLHISRVLCAFGVPSRIGLLVVVGADRQLAAVPVPATLLTRRQGEVATRVANAQPNQQIAAELGISVKGVEKHIAAIRSRWQVSSRFEIARTWWATEG